MSIIFRNDDVNSNSNYKQLMAIYDTIKEYVPNAEIWSVWCPTCVYRPNSNLIYPANMYPIRHQDEKDLMKINHIGFPLEGGLYYRLATHGLYHISHKNKSRDFQAMSILSTARLLKTNIFVPPFSEWDNITEKVCTDNNIRLIKSSDGWKSLESEPFNPNHPLWFFHSWRYTPEKFREIFNVGKIVGQLS